MCCPKCSTKLDIELLELDLQGGDERLFLVRCPEGDYRAADSETRVSELDSYMVANGNRVEPITAVLLPPSQ